VREEALIDETLTDESFIDESLFRGSSRGTRWTVGPEELLTAWGER
jgi:hypothetical protein